MISLTVPACLVPVYVNVLPDLENGPKKVAVPVSVAANVSVAVELEYPSPFSVIV